MSLSAAEKASLLSQAQALGEMVEALQVDPVPHPLQVALDAANAQIASLTSQLSAKTAELATANETIMTLQGKIASARDSILAAKAARAQEDAAGAEQAAGEDAALQHLGE